MDPFRRSSYLEDDLIKVRMQEQKRMGVAGFMTEFGAYEDGFGDDLADARRLLGLADDNLQRCRLVPLLAVLAVLEAHPATMLFTRSLSPAGVCCVDSGGRVRACCLGLAWPGRGDLPVRACVCACMRACDGQLHVLAGEGVRRPHHRRCGQVREHI